MRKAFIVSIIVVLLLPFAQLGQTRSVMANGNLPATHEKIDPKLQSDLSLLGPEEMTTVIVTLAEQTDLSQIPSASRAARQEGVINALQATAQASQGSIRSHLTALQAQGNVERVTPFWVFNGLAVTARRDVIQNLATRSDVYKITPDVVDIVQTGSLVLNPPEQNLTLINAPALWDQGLYGQGIVVANMDTGVDASHPDLALRFRGGTNSWFDPYNQHATPFDMSGHGTQTMGVMIGGDAGGTTIGVAPQAQWVAVKIFNDAGTATSTAIHLGFQWLLDPDGNPATADAPQVVNNSWVFSSPGCNLEFQHDLQSLRAADILPVFSAGNYGPNGSTSASPANYPEAFAVGAVDNNDQIATFSSRGPSACGETQSIYPELVAPGVGIKSTDLYGFYTYATGTSLAAPHVSGALALLLSAFPDLNALQQQSALVNGATDLGLPGADNDFGFGRMDVLASYQWLQENISLTPGKPVTVSSLQDSAHAGEMAVDGDLATFWQTATARGKNKLPSEWITVDLGRSTSITWAQLDWEAYYATSYTLQVSDDNTNWTTVYSTLAGDGAGDSLIFNPTSARYIKLDTTAWNSGSLRNWLKEISVFAAGAPLPPPPPPPTPTPAPTPPGGGISMHIGDLDGTATIVNNKSWKASVSLWVHDRSENPVANATISGRWSGGISGTVSCVTGSSGSCQIVSGNIKNSYLNVTLSVTDVIRSSDTYNATANHDLDGDSDGTSITVLKP